MLKCLIIFFSLILLSNIKPSEFKTLEELYDFWAADYKKLVEITNYKIRDWITEKKDFLPAKEQLVLDLGCADGMVGEFIHNFNKNYKFIGIDFSKNMIEQCAKNSSYIVVLQADLSNGLPESINNHSYDIVLALGCLEFIENHDNLFDQIQQKLKSGGQFWLTLQDSHNKHESALDKALNLYSCEQAKELLKRHNFSILEFESAIAYRNSRTQEPCFYFMVIAQKK